MTLSPTERADKLLEVLCDPDDQDDKRRGRPDLDLLPPGSLVLTADEAKTVRRPLVHHPRNWRGMWDQMRVEALALLSPTSNVDSRPE